MKQSEQDSEQREGNYRQGERQTGQQEIVFGHEKTETRNVTRLDRGQGTGLVRVPGVIFV